MQQQFSFFANLSSSVDGSPTIEEAAALYLDPRHRFLSVGVEALNETEAISLILGERDYRLAARLLVSFGSLTVKNARRSKTTRFGITRFAPTWNTVLWDDDTR